MLMNKPNCKDNGKGQNWGLNKLKPLLQLKQVAVIGIVADDVLTSKYDKQGSLPEVTELHKKYLELSMKSVRIRKNNQRLHGMTTHYFEHPLNGKLGYIYELKPCSLN